MPPSFTAAIIPFVLTFVFPSERFNDNFSFTPTTLTAIDTSYASGNTLKLTTKIGNHLPGESYNLHNNYVDGIFIKCIFFSRY